MDPKHHKKYQNGTANGTKITPKSKKIAPANDTKIDPKIIQKGRRTRIKNG